MVEHGLHDSAEDELGDACALFDGVASVGKDLRLDDGHKTIVLADGTKAGEDMSGLTNSKYAWAATVDLKDSSQLYEAKTFSIEGGGLFQIVDTLISLQIHTVVELTLVKLTLVELNANMDVSLAKEFNKVLTIFGGLVNILIHGHT